MSLKPAPRDAKPEVKQDRAPTTEPEPEKKPHGKHKNRDNGTPKKRRYRSPTPEAGPALPEYK